MVDCNLCSMSPNRHLSFIVSDGHSTKATNPVRVVSCPTWVTFQLHDCEQGLTSVISSVVDAQSSIKVFIG